MLHDGKVNTDLAYLPQFLQASLLNQFKLQEPFFSEPLNGYSLSHSETT